MRLRTSFRNALYISLRLLTVQLLRLFKACALCDVCIMAWVVICLMQCHVHCGTAGALPRGHTAVASVRDRMPLLPRQGARRLLDVALEELVVDVVELRVLILKRWRRLAECQAARDSKPIYGEFEKMQGGCREVLDVASSGPARLASQRLTKPHLESDSHDRIDASSIWGCWARRRYSPHVVWIIHSG